MEFGILYPLHGWRGERQEMEEKMGKEWKYGPSNFQTVVAPMMMMCNLSSFVEANCIAKQA